MATPSPDSDATKRIESDGLYTPYPRGAQAQFAPGTIIAGRYRIAGILGSGGMGEVYRADDIKLDQTVALKFLPARLARDPILLARLHDEVRLGRQIAHPNVCRIYDIVDWEGAHFLAMEFVDGEDLSRLLRRIGRLAHDKAVDIARGIAAGLAAAHGKGILHRDLKPANIIIDSRGDARIMDFGLALGAGEDDGTISGTPAYMAPEQFDGQPATIQSDLYALGLVMYELFTGKRALAGRTVPERIRDLTSEITTPSSVVRDIDSAVERVILRCLSNDPAHRPRSAREVIEALPGGDPLAAALAAGETPSPGLVAAAGAEGSLKPAVAWSLLATAVLTIVAVVLYRNQHSLLQRYPLEKPPQVLAHRAEEILREAGIPAQPFRSEKLSPNIRYIAWIASTDKSMKRWDRLREGAAVTFTVRETPRPETPKLDRPAGGVPGMTEVVLSARGELVSLIAVPGPAWTARPLDWKPLLAAAGLDPSTLTPVPAEFVPPAAADARAAWSGRYPVTGTPMRVEAAAWRGTPVLFRVSGPWENISGEAVDRQTFRGGGVNVMVTAVTILAFTVALILAWRNLRFRRGDRQGAFRIAVAKFALLAVAVVLLLDHQLDLRHEIEILQLGIGEALVGSLLAFVAYMAFEPFIRRRWPSAIISWTRLIGGRVNDPMVGRDVLAGVVVGAIHTAISTFSWSLAAAIHGEAPPLPITGNFDALRGVRFAVSHVAWSASTAMTFGFVMLVILAAITMAVRNRAAAVALVAALGLTLHGMASGSLTMFLVASIPAVTVVIVALVRFGLLGFVVGQFAFVCTFHYAMPVGVNWWTGMALIGPAAVIALGIWAFRTSLGGQRAFALDQA